MTDTDIKPHVLKRQYVIEGVDNTGKVLSYIFKTETIGKYDGDIFISFV
jgi:hypothetical protein